ncbi:MAG: hypothetical protein WDO74_31605 [Pseudomonadota bacterium]
MLVREHALRDQLCAARHRLLGRKHRLRSRGIAWAQRDFRDFCACRGQVLEYAGFMLEAALFQHAPLDLVFAGASELPEGDGELEHGLVLAFAEAAQVRGRERKPRAIA